MILRNYFYLFLYSLTICIGLTPLGGYVGFNLKFLLATLIYFSSTFYFLNKSQSSKAKLIIILIFVLPPLIIFLPVHLNDWSGALISFPSTLAYFIGIIFGALAHFAQKRTKFILAIFLLMISSWTYFKGYALWINKVNFGTYTGNVSYKLPVSITGQNQLGQSVSEESFKNKIVILDFWHTRCGVCFQKFPVLQSLYDTYKNDTSIIFFAVNKPLKQDSLGQAFAVLKERNYSFPILLPTIDSLPELFGVHVYPTTIVVDRNGTVIFRGQIEKVKPILLRLAKKGI